MKHTLIRIIAMAMIAIATLQAGAQPQPMGGPGGPGGPGGAPTGGPNGPGPGGGPAGGPIGGPANPIMTGGPWGPGIFTGPIFTPALNFNSGISHVISVGYDVQGVWQTVPLVVSWDWNTVYYDVTVMRAWNPWTRVWNGGLNMPAYQTEYTLRGVTYDYYVNLSTGTYYFNL